MQERVDDRRADQCAKRIHELMAKSGTCVEWGLRFWPWALASLARRSRTFSAAMILSVCALSVLPASAQTYTVTNLGTLGGLSTLPAAVNDTGQVVGQSQTAGGPVHAFLWTSESGMVDLGTLGGTYSYATAINDAGQVVGYSHNTEAYLHSAFLWTAEDGMVNLGTLGGTSCSSATGINNAGQVVGWSEFNGGEVYAFLWTPEGGMVNLNELIPTGSVGTWLQWADGISSTGFIIARSGLRHDQIPPGGDAFILSLVSSVPVLGPIAANDPVAVGNPVSLGASFKDDDAGETYAAEWSWGDGTADSVGNVSQAGDSWTAESSHVYLEAGIYTVSLKITDSSGLTAEASRDVVVFDPLAGFVTGGGWIMSPPGAFEQDQALAGRAAFKFVFKYLKRANRPTGQVEFQFPAANLDFYGADCEWLVVSGSRAMCQGTGTINGTGSYRFLLTAVDGNQEGNTPADRFRIQIWYYDSDLDEDVVVYDNQLDSSGSQEGTPLSGGNVVIHK